jgi:DNA-binding MarR family transcriptional regulator
MPLMDASLSYLQSHSNPFVPPPVLIGATSDTARARAARIIQASGLRIGDAVPIDQFAERVQTQATATAVWLQIDQDPGPSMDLALSKLNHDVAAQLYSAIVCAPSELIDLIFTKLSDEAQLLIDPSDAECAAALALASARRQDGLRLSDVSTDQDSVRLRQLSDEVNRIASTLARLSESRPSSYVKPDADIADVPPLSKETVRTVIQARRLREKFLPENLFADPAWDIMLDLLQAEIVGFRIQVSSLCIAAAVPPTTALRWLTSMVKQGLLVRSPDPRDGRRVFIELAPDLSAALRRYFAAVKSIVPI